jgi:hypothetical protein
VQSGGILIVLKTLLPVPIDSCPFQPHVRRLIGEDLGFRPLEAWKARLPRFAFPRRRCQDRPQSSAANHPSRNATTPATIRQPAMMRQAVARSRSATTEIAMANRIEVSRSAATEAIGAFVIAHIAIQ